MLVINKLPALACSPQRLTPDARPLMLEANISPKLMEISPDRVVPVSVHSVPEDIASVALRLEDSNPTFTAAFQEPSRVSKANEEAKV